MARHRHLDEVHDHPGGEVPHVHDGDEVVLLRQYYAPAEPDTQDDIAQEFDEAVESVAQDPDPEAIAQTSQAFADSKLASALRNSSRAQQEAVEAERLAQAAGDPESPPELGVEASRVAADAVRHQSQAEQMAAIADQVAERAAQLQMSAQSFGPAEAVIEVDPEALMQPEPVADATDSIPVEEPQAVEVTKVVRKQGLRLGGRRYGR